MSAKLGRSDWIEVQKHLNDFTDEYLAGVAHLIVDGKPGALTRRHIRMARWWLGYDRSELDSEVTLNFRRRLTAPKSEKWAPRAQIHHGEQRRTEQRRSWEHNLQAAARKPGVGKFDGVPCANWIIPHLEWARVEGPKHGVPWHGVLISGWRDPHHSQDLCIAMCGAPSCPGRCAGLASNHVGDDPPPNPRGAADVSDYEAFDRAMKKCPLEPRLFNALGAADPNHFSPSGR